MLTEEEKARLILFVRRMAGGMLGQAAEEDLVAPFEDLPYGGLFVTFRNNGRLRGCMGTLKRAGGFFAALRDVTLLALHDPRFAHMPIGIEELPLLEIEISILTPPEPVTDPALLVAGRHGIVITREGRSGCFLPQVAVERGWDMTAMLSQCCVLKAGLDADAWRDPAARLEAFEVELVAEKPRRHSLRGTA